MPTAPPLPDLLPVFNAQPGATLLLSPEWIIVGASDDYLAATLTERDVIVGQHIFDAFPDNPEMPEANAVANVRASIAQVLATKQPHTMAPQHYDVPDPARPGRFVERHWQPRHTPVLDAQGQVQFIIQSVQDITARRVAERQLRESQAGEQAARAEADHEKANVLRLFEQATVAIALLQGSDYRVALANPEMLRIWGRTAAQTLNYPVFAALPEIAGQGFEAIFADVLQHGTPYDLREVPVQINRGHTDRPTLGYFHLMYRPQYDAHGRITGIVTMAIEVTEQVLARQQLEQLNQELEARVLARTREVEIARAYTERQRRQWEDLFRNAPPGICIFDGPEWVYEFVNPSYQAMFPGRELLGKRLVDALPEVADQPLMDILHRVYDTGETFKGQEVLVPLARTAEGPVEDIYFDLTYQARTNEAGQINGFVTYAYDVTNQVRARRQLEQREASFRTMADAAPAMLWVTDPAGQCTYLNAQWYRFTGQTEAEALGLGWTTAVHPDDAEQAGRVFLDANARRALFHLRYRLRRHDGVYRWATDTGLPHYTEAGEYAGIVGTVIDVHEQQLAEEELLASNEQLRRTNVDLDNFIYTASHDLKAPISNIEGLLYLLQDELPPAVTQDAEVESTLTRMLGSVERFKRTIDHLTDVSKLQKEHAPVTTQVNLAAVVEDVHLDLAPLLQATGAKLVVDVPALPAILFSEKNLRSIVYNLLSNAVKYHSPDRPPRVDVRAHVRPGHTVLEVHDNGLGIAAHQLPKLFGMFQRLHDHVEGSGIGLYMIKRMVDNAGGRIEVHSQLGAGTTFFVFLPHTARTNTTPFPAYLPS